MRKTELLDIFRRGENPEVVFRPDTITNGTFAKEVTALMNLRGGRVILGVEEASLFSSTTQNINLHLADIVTKFVTDRAKTEFELSQIEGSRSINRRIIHFSLEVVHMISLRSQAWEEQNWIVNLAEEFAVGRSYYRIIPKKERDFGELFLGALTGITKVETQYRIGRHRIDFFLPDFRIAVEYDERHHQRESLSLQDREREQEISREFGEITFIRVDEGAEINGLNQVLRLIVDRIEQNSGGSRDERWLYHIEGAERSPAKD